MNIGRSALVTSLFLALVQLAACTPSDQDVLNTLAEPIVGLDEALLVKGEENCPIHEIHVPGQVPRLNGSTGGLALLNQLYPNPPTALTSPAPTGQYVMRPAGAATHDVGILVVDDFGKDNVYRLPQAVFDLPRTTFLNKDDSETRAIELQAVLDNLQTAGQLSHGSLVFNHINALILSTDSYTFSSNESSPALAVFKNAFGHRIYVQAVNVEHFNTGVIRERVETAFTDLAVNHGVIDVSVNMSFAVVPCSVRNNFVDYRPRYPTFERYVTALQEKNPSRTLEEIRSAVVTPIYPDPLHTFIQSQSFGNRVYVASSGNYALDYPMYPAAWPEVVSVSSNDYDLETTPSNFSNRGEVMITGGWFTLTNPGGINGSWGDSPEIVYAGTSFSAPAVSVFTAYNLAASPVRCGLVTGTRRPDLSYTTMIRHTAWDIKDLLTIYNVQLTNAVSRYCGR